MSNPARPYRYLPTEYDDLRDLHTHLKEITEGYRELQYEDVVWESLSDTINTIENVLERMEQGD